MGASRVAGSISRRFIKFVQQRPSQLHKVQALELAPPISAGPALVLRSISTAASTHNGTLSTLSPSRPEPARAAPWQAVWSRGYADGEFTAVVPSMGESITDGSLAALLKGEGDHVEADEVIAQIETDKVTIDVRVPDSGTITGIKVKEGDTVTPGTVVATLTKGDAPPKTDEAPAEPKAEEPKKETPKKEAPPPPKEDKKAAVAPPPPKPATPPPPKAAQPAHHETPQLVPKERERRVAMTRLRKRVATRLKDSQNTFALLTTFNEIDMTNIMQLRSDFKDAFLEKHGVKLGFMSGFVKAAAESLKRSPVVNAVIDGDDIIYRDYVDVSIAVGTPKGLVVPVLRDADKLGFAGIEKKINELGEKARTGTLSIDEMAGGTFTISNGGVYGSLLSTPIVNPPQSAILGMHSIQKRPMVVGADIKARPMMYVALTYDHRLIDGREAVLFLRNVKDIVEDPRRLLLDI